WIVQCHAVGGPPATSAAKCTLWPTCGVSGAISNRTICNPDAGGEPGAVAVGLPPRVISGDPLDCGRRSDGRGFGVGREVACGAALVGAALGWIPTGWYFTIGKTRPSRRTTPARSLFGSL